MIRKKITTLLLVSIFGLVPCVVFAVNGPGEAMGLPSTQTYHLLSPLPIFGDTVAPNNFSGYAQSLITLIIGAAAVLAVIMIMVGGFMYMGGESVRTKSTGSSFIKHAIGGLLLLLGSYLVLNTINPQLLNLNLNLPQIAQNPGTNPGTPTPTPTGSGTDTGRFCFATGNGSQIGDVICRDTLSQCLAEGGKSARPGSPSVPAGSTPPADGVCYAMASTPTPTPTTGGGTLACDPTTHNCTYTSSIYGQNLTCTNCTTLGNIPMKPGQCAGQTCYAGSQIVGDLKTLADSPNMAGVAWEVTEAWPPTVHHFAPCQADGSCVDATPLGQISGDTVNIFSQQAEQAGMIAVYEAQAPQNIPSGVDQSLVKTTIVPTATGNHFSLYATKAACLAAGYSDKTVCN